MVEYRLAALIFEAMLLTVRKYERPLMYIMGGRHGCVQYWRAPRCS